MNKAEQQFQSYLNKHNIPFWFIQQDLETYSKTLKQFNTKRPDFFILIPNFGSILIDIKDTTPLKKHKKICLDYKEIIKYNNLQKYFNMQVWYIISNNQVHYSTWYCMPASKAIQFKRFLVNNKYLSIPLEEYFQISINEPFYNLLKCISWAETFINTEISQRFNEKKFTKVEKERTDEMEVAEEATEKREKKEK